MHLDAGLAGTGGAFDTLAGLLADPDEARTFTDAQHAGSLAAARVLAGRLDLGGARSLLDVGGGSGAFSIALCAANPGLRATVLDLPAVLAVAAEQRAAAGLTDRISLLPGDAPPAEWPGGQDVVLMSYLLSALDDEQIDVVLARAAACLDAGGLLVVHDFVLDDDGAGRSSRPCGSCSTSPTTRAASASPPPTWPTGCAPTVSPTRRSRSSSPRSPR